MARFILPEFAKSIVEKYKSLQNNQFLLYGNINDLYPYKSNVYLSLSEFIEQALVNPKHKTPHKIIIHYDLAKGLEIPVKEDKKLLSTEFDASLLDKIIVKSITNPLAALNFLVEATNRAFYRVKAVKNGCIKEKIPLAVVLNYADALLPEGGYERLSDADRQRITLFLEWFSNRQFAHSTNIVFIISETLSSINDKIRDLPYLAPIKIVRPDSRAREKYIRFQQTKFKLKLKMTYKQIAFYTAGLTLVDIQQIFHQASYSGKCFTSASIFSKTKEIIEKELSGHVEIQEIDYGFEKVIGARQLKKKLLELRKCINSGKKELMPVGILVPGPNGVGKTYIFKAFAKECGWITVVLKNIRGAYVGETESRWERIRNVLESMGKVMVFYDEADTQLGGRGSQTHDVDKRLFGSIMSMMSDTKNQGKIIWIIISARPDKLEPDIKRTGRAGEHLSVFDPEGEEKEEFLSWIFKRIGFNWQMLHKKYKDKILDHTQSFSAADFEGLLHLCKRRKYIAGKLDIDMLLRESENFIPADISLQRELQEMVALVECTSADLIPQRYKHMKKDEILDRIKEIKEILRED